MKMNLRSETAAAIVAGAAFFASAGHIVHVVSETNHIAFALAYPIGIDGLMYVGIRAVQSGRRVAGLFALLVGAVFSLAFNAHAEQAIVMPRLMIASSMPICLFVAFLIEATAEKKVEEAPAAPVPAPPLVVPASVPAAAPVPAPAVRPAPVRPAITGRTAAWDVSKAIVLIRDEKTNEEIASTLGTNAKAIQRTRRALVLIADGQTDEEIVATMKNAVSVAHVARVRAAQ